MLESISQAFQGVFSHKLRSFLTMLGIIIGIASIITIISTIKGTNEQIKENLIGAGNNVVTVQLSQHGSIYEMTYNPLPVGVKVLDESTRTALRGLDGVQDVSFYRQRSYAESVYYQNTSFNGQVFGVDLEYFRVNGYQIKLGRGFTERDISSVLNTVILDEAAAKTLFGSENPIGKTLEIKQVPFTIVGVVALKSNFEPVINSVEDYNTYVGNNNGGIYVPESSWPLIYRFDEPQSVAVSATSTDDMTVAGRGVEDYLNEHMIAEKVLKDGMEFRSSDITEQAAQMQQMSQTTSKQLIWIASISLLVGGVGVMNIMLVTVTERTGEIGLKKAIGAKRRRILVQFLTEAAVLTGIGGLLGVAGGIGLSEAITRFADTPTAISVPAIVAAAAFSILIGLIFGFFPAVKASKLNPIVALRRE